MNRPMQIAIIGNGRIAKECAKILQETAGVNLARIIVDDSRSNISTDLRKYCEAQGLDFIVSESINSHEVIEYLNGGSVDLIFSINNHQIIRGRLLDVANDGIINFHNGPLPRYGGLNACSWAIFNGEMRHGVTWHYINAGVDEGDIVVQKLFNIDSEATALQLVMTCIKEGIELFKILIVDLLAGKITRTPQDKSMRLYYFEREVPGEGVINFSQDYESIERLVRSLNFNPIESPLGRATVFIKDRKFFVDKVRAVRRVQQGKNSEVIRADNVLEIQAMGTILEVIEARSEDKRRISIEELIKNYSIQQGIKLNKD